MNIKFTEKQQNYIKLQVESGDFQNASEVVREALRLHEFYRDKLLRDLRVEIEKGWESAPSRKSVADIIESKRKQLKNG